MNKNISLNIFSVLASKAISLFANKNSLSHILQQQIEKLKDYRGASTVRNYRTAIHSFQDYLEHDIQLDELNSDILSGYERWLLQRGVSMNTSSCYIRSLRSLLITYDETLRKLFNNVYTGNSKTRKRSVSIDMLSRLNSLQLQKGSFLELARDIFLFSFYAMGMPFVDVAHLRWSQIHNDYLVYNRQKTGQQIRVAMESPMQTILFKHHKQAKGIFAFPLLLQGTDHEYLVVLGRYNRALLRLEKIAGIDEHLTSYVIRHTWASTAFSENIDLPVISKALGHSNTQTTLIYISEIDDNRVADANRRMMQKITNCNFNV